MRYYANIILDIISSLHRKWLPGSGDSVIFMLTLKVIGFVCTSFFFKDGIFVVSFGVSKNNIGKINNNYC